MSIDRRRRDLQDYTERFGRETEPRISRNDEQRLTDVVRVREREEHAERDAQQAAVDAERRFELRRRIDHAIVALEHVHEPLALMQRRSDARFVDRCCRWLRNLAEDLRRDG